MDVLNYLDDFIANNADIELRSSAWRDGLQRALSVSWMLDGTTIMEAPGETPEDAVRSYAKLMKAALAYARIDPTDVGTSFEVALRDGWRLRWSQKESKWYVYDHSVWKDEDREGATMATLNAAMWRTPANGGPLKKVTQASVNSAKKGAQAHLAISSEAFDRFPNLLNTPAGVYDLATSSLRPHESSMLLTKQTFVPIGDRPSEMWLSHLERLTRGDAEQLTLLQVAAGISIYGGSDKPQKFILLRGQGRNGKGVFLRTLKAALGSYFTVVSRGLFTQKDEAIPHEIVKLRGARIAACLEAPQDQINAGALNSLTGGDELVGRRLYQNEVPAFKPTYLPLWICGNEGLSLSGKANTALWERCIFVDVGPPIPSEDRDDTFETKLQTAAELGGVLRWCVDGWKMFMDNARRIPDTQAGQAYVAAAKVETDMLGQFLAESLLDSPGERTKLNDIEGAFNGWCYSRGRRDYSDVMMAIRDRFKDKLITLDGINYVEGVTLKQSGLQKSGFSI